MGWRPAAAASKRRAKERRASHVEEDDEADDGDEEEDGEALPRRLPGAPPTGGAAGRNVASVGAAASRPAVGATRITAAGRGSATSTQATELSASGQNK